MILMCLDITIIIGQAVFALAVLGNLIEQKEMIEMLPTTGHDGGMTGGLTTYGNTYCMVGICRNTLQSDQVESSPSRVWSTLLVLLTTSPVQRHRQRCPTLYIV